MAKSSEFDLLVDMAIEDREWRREERKKRQQEGASIEQQYTAAIARAQKNFDIVRRKLDRDEEEGKPVNPDLLDRLTLRREQLEDIKKREEAEISAKKEFKATWKAKTIFGLDADFEAAWLRERVRIMENSHDDLVEKARNTQLYAS